MQKHPFTFPKIGIRPTIDGRLGGVRESLEDQTMAMAQRVADLTHVSCATSTAVPSSASLPTATSEVFEKQPPAKKNSKEKAWLSLPP